MHSVGNIERSGARRRNALECWICFGVMCAPVVAPCGHSFCRACMETYVGYSAGANATVPEVSETGEDACSSSKKRRRTDWGEGKPCPVCREPLGSGVYPNKALERVLDSVKKRLGGETTLTENAIEALSEEEAERLLQKLLERKVHKEEIRDMLRKSVMKAFLERCERENYALLARVQRNLAIIRQDRDQLGGKDGDSDAPGEQLSSNLSVDVSSQSALIERYHEDAQSMYFTRRAVRGESLEDVTTSLVQASSLAGATLGASIQRYDVTRNASNSLISSVKFDATAKMFATAGVTKCIKIFEFDSVLAAQRHSADAVHFPVMEVPVAHKISCLAWNSARSCALAAATYNGDILLQDIQRNARLRTLAEHTQRAWYLDFSTQQPDLLVSGSDDKTVRVWDAFRETNSVITIATPANVCCVKFNPGAVHELAFGSADHNVYSYDLRYPKTPLCLFEGHWRAVSYVRFLNRSELVSASTDSSCKLWNVSRQESGLNYAGHVNDRHFVGLSGDGDFFACGSEDNSLYIYHKAFSGPVLRYPFNAPGSFVSTVCWKPRSNWIVAANNAGTVELVQLTHNY